MATTVVKQGSVPVERPMGWALMGLAALALAALTVAAVTVLSQGPASSPAEARPATRVYTADERAAIRLVADGVLPASILDAEPFRTKQLVAQPFSRGDRTSAAAPSGVGGGSVASGPASGYHRSPSSAPPQPSRERPGHGHYGRATEMDVPLLSPSGSWLSPDA